MSSDTTYCLLLGTGIILVQNGYHFRQLLATHRGIFDRDGVGSIIPPKSWVIKTSSDEAARDLAKELRASVRRSISYSPPLPTIGPSTPRPSSGGNLSKSTSAWGTFLPTVLRT
ncbi:hypothetical protein Esi_0092_0018 [Ectocarpus siliculosus]|uniref:Uncharacterized protein n=1 Tax=Ectocarpus siliculosus TaxID=2880 RepID=D7G8U6_ECTSI|nr:hypothetical protein Esi_0092_0018 [Ectocarpus siliculosus]|eukprot:CBJ28114.1 hypothetical protein Esi_0092_0018 [Ectocarpus siliculosus]